MNYKKKEQENIQNNGESPSKRLLESSLKFNLKERKLSQLVVLKELTKNSGSI